MANEMAGAGGLNAAVRPYKLAKVL